MHLKILIVDDEEDILDIVEFTLNSFIPDNKIEIHRANSAASAISLLTQDSSINYTICDHNMPGGKGSEVLSFITQSNHQAKFLLCSTYTPQDLPIEYPNCFSYIQKPDISFHIEKFVKMMSLPKTERIYCPISIKILHLLGNAPAEVYIKLSDQKYLQCLSQDDIFSDHDFEKYESKKIKHFLDVNFKVGPETAIKYLIINIHYLNKAASDHSGVAINFTKIK
jgi:CheY-like chemotaxis protein